MHNPKERGFMNEKDETDYLPNQLINMLILLNIDLRRNFINNITKINMYNRININILSWQILHSWWDS